MVLGLQYSRETPAASLGGLSKSKWSEVQHAHEGFVEGVRCALERELTPVCNSSAKTADRFILFSILMNIIEKLSENDNVLKNISICFEMFLHSSSSTFGDFRCVTE